MKHSLSHFPAPMPPRFLLSCACLGWLASTAVAATPIDPILDSPAPNDDPVSTDKNVNDLARISVQAQRPAIGFHHNGPTAVTKSNVPLDQMPMSIDVLTRDLLDSQQVRGLNEALQNAAGVVAGNYGRRGWDDIIIRGQTASDSLFLDGLRTTTSSRVAEQTYGLGQIEVFKGPASLLYGQVLPGGLVNMVSKRPQSEAFARGELTTGSYGLRQGSVDVNQPLSDDRLALRINALAMNSDDATDHVWFRERWIAPSLSIDLGPDSDLVLLTSYQQRQYIRQQGLPLVGSIYPNPNGALPRDLFTGEAGQRPYEAEQRRVGYVFEHRFDNGWSLHNGLRWQSFDVEGDLVSNGAVSADGTILTRSAQHQVFSGRTWVQDTYLSRHFETGPASQSLTVGLDAFKTWEWASPRTCTVGKLSLYAPAYSGINCASTSKTSTLGVVRSAGLYARDQIRFGEDLQLLLGLRQDNARTTSRDLLSGTTTTSSNDSATTGSAALMYDLRPGLHPYLSYASSFYPNSGTDAQGRGFDPEQGRQWELGVKVDLASATTLSAAVFDLRRRNVLENDPLNDSYSIAIGEQRSRGGEISLNADLGSGLSISAAYAYTDATITDDGGQANTTVGQRLNNVPRNSGSLWLRYDPQADSDGWYASAGLRAADARYTNGYMLAGYTLFDIGSGYRRGRWDYALNVRNLFDHDYYAGGLAAAVALGDPRTMAFKVGFRY